MITGETLPKANDRVFDDPYQPLASRADLLRIHSERFLDSIDRSLALQPRDRWQDGKQWLASIDAPAVQAPRISQIALVGAPVSVAPAARVALALLASYPGEEREFEIAPGVLMKMCWIPPGEFVMGSPADELGRKDGETQHLVTLTQGFWLGKYGVTQAQWEAVMGTNPSSFKGDNLPVESVRWDDVAAPGGFLEKANRHGSRTGQFHLPTEAQWEYACRAETTMALNSGKNLTSTTGACPNLDEVAWYHKNSGERTHPVGRKAANTWGLHDMHGNVYEWCADWYAKYPNGAATDPFGSNTDSQRVLRGGSWSSDGSYCTSAVRNYCSPTYRSNRYGFRVVLAPGQAER